MASPIEVSAAATVNMKIASIWPSRSSKQMEYTSKLKFIESKQSSTAISISKIFLRLVKMPQRLIMNTVNDTKFMINFIETLCFLYLEVKTVLSLIFLILLTLADFDFCILSIETVIQVGFLSLK